MERVLLGALVDQGMRVWSARLRMLGRSMEHGFKKYLVAELELRGFFLLETGVACLSKVGQVTCSSSAPSQRVKRPSSSSSSSSGCRERVRGS